MITLYLYDDTYIALANGYEHKEEIKALAPYPDVKWDSTDRSWLVHAGLLDKLLDTMADKIAPPSVDFWMGYPLHPPAVTRKSQAQQAKERAIELKHAQRWGKQLVKEMHK